MASLRAAVGVVGSAVVVVMRRAVWWWLGLLVAAVLALPPQVMQVDFRHDLTVVQFWLPSLVQTSDGWFMLATSLRVADDSPEASWSLDHRGSRRLP